MGCVVLARACLHTDSDSRKSQLIALADFGVRELVLGVVGLLTLYLVISVLRLFYVGTNRADEMIAYGSRADFAVEGTEDDVPSADEGDNEAATEFAPGYAPSAFASVNGGGTRVTSVAEVVAAAAEVDVVTAVKRSRFEFLKRLLHRRAKSAEKVEPDVSGMSTAAEAGNEPSLAASAAPSAPVAGPAIAQNFAQDLARSNLEVEVQRLHREGTVLRDELARLSEEVTRLKSARSVSPLYSEAVTLAQRGMAAVSIADRCGISMAEAELVAALVKGSAGAPPLESISKSSFETNFETNVHEEDRYESTTERGNRRHG